jgi:hypothetical protein
MLFISLTFKVEVLLLVHPKWHLVCEYVQCTHLYCVQIEKELPHNTCDILIIL